jgi:hypothetical protein
VIIGFLSGIMIRVTNTAEKNGSLPQPITAPSTGVGRCEPMSNPYQTTSNPYEPPRSPEFIGAAEDRNGRATASLVLGLISIIAWFIPVIGLPVTITGLVLGIKGLGPQRRGTAIAGIVLSIVFLVLTLLNAAGGVYLWWIGQHPLIK